MTPPLEQQAVLPKETIDPRLVEAIEIHTVMRGLSRTKQKELRRTKSRTQRSKWFIR